ncbi:chromosome segregation ATPase [Actinomadura sp. KC345]|uniref:chromosome segregation ATPase n=1 Tax=Actinomadura sp. KC345 TaxID=2530371 RepID=UPI00105271BB|nr:chromosome segregation ATPase [Actinomadura sp. KC345]TDC47240.1 chromosome segregation ATPase [Actinomadura sp. KC345]
MKDKKVAPLDGVVPTPAPTKTDLPVVADPAAHAKAVAAATAPRRDSRVVQASRADPALRAEPGGEPAAAEAPDTARPSAAPAPPTGDAARPFPEEWPLPGGRRLMEASAVFSASSALAQMASGDEDDRAGTARLGDPVAVWPCAGCGRPVPQPAHDARIVRYCQDTDGECERSARENRERGRESPGLTGQVAWAWEMVERLEGATDRLAWSLMSELSVAGVERRVADANADAFGQVAIAQRERDASQRQAEVAWRETAAARARADAAEQEAAAARTRAEHLAAELDTAGRERRKAKEEAEAASAARLAAEHERDRVASREGELLASLESARAELVSLHGRLSEAETLVEGQRIEAEAVKRATEDLRSAVGDAEAKRGQAVADRDQIQARGRELEQHNWQLIRTAEELRATVHALTAERDAARAEAERARRRVDALTGNGDVYRTGGLRPPIDREPPTGLHPLPPMSGSSPDGGDPLTTDPSRQYGPLNGHRLPYAG